MWKLRHLSLSFENKEVFLKNFTTFNPNMTHAKPIPMVIIALYLKDD